MRVLVSFGEFLDAYLVPRKRQPYSKRSGAEIQELTQVEAIKFFARDLVEDVISIAEPEDIASWSNCLLDVMEKERSYSFSRLVKISGLSPGQVFLALFLSGCFELI